MIRVLYAPIGEMLSGQAWDRYFLEMPRSVRARISRYRRWEDRQAGLFGKLLLAEGLVQCGYPSEHLQNLVRDTAGRPFLGLRIDFNISHSGGYAVCALCTAGRVGIDIEEIRPIDISDFKAHMTHDQWEEMMRSENRLEKFFTLWTQKEAVIKADGRGIALPLDKIAIAGEMAFLADDIWWVNEVKIADGYCCHLATSRMNQNVRIEKISYGEVVARNLQSKR
jgi:4'-phosphopantetheinyl transferase